MIESEKKFIYIYIAWIINIISFAGSMYFSNIMMLPPCTLCWYQRICIFPMSLILAAGFLLKDKNVIWYTMPLAVIGWIISFYHNLLYYKVISQAIIACSSGVSCTAKQIEYLGFVTIPLMALTSLTLTIILLIKFYTAQRKS